MSSDGKFAQVVLAWNLHIHDAMEVCAALFMEQERFLKEARTFDVHAQADAITYALLRAQGMSEMGRSIAKGIQEALDGVPEDSEIPTGRVILNWTLSEEDASDMLSALRIAKSERLSDAKIAVKRKEADAAAFFYLRYTALRRMCASIDEPLRAIDAARADETSVNAGPYREAEIEAEITNGKKGSAK